MSEALMELGDTAIASMEQAAAKPCKACAGRHRPHTCGRGRAGDSKVSQPRTASATPSTTIVKKRTHVKKLWLPAVGPADGHDDAGGGEVRHAPTDRTAARLAQEALEEAKRARAPQQPPREKPPPPPPRPVPAKPERAVAATSSSACDACAGKHRAHTCGRQALDRAATAAAEAKGDPLALFASVAMAEATGPSSAATRPPAVKKPRPPPVETLESVFEAAPGSGGSSSVRRAPTDRTAARTAQEAGEAAKRASQVEQAALLDGAAGVLLGLGMIGMR